MKVCSVIVTYGDRFHLLKQVITACFKEGIDKVIVVDNASAENSRKQLKEFEEENKEKIKVIYLDENTGSAGGYKRGLEEAYKCKECEFIWLLDDDNEPQKNSLKVLKEFWNKLDEEDKEEKIALLSYRNNAFLQKEVVIKNKDSILIGRQNSFLKFHIFDLLSKTLKLIMRKFNLYNNFNQYKLGNNFGQLPVSTYGGLFIHKKIINKIGLPNEKFYLYMDDYEWTYRITKSNGNIYLLLNSTIKEIDENWMESKGINSLFFNILNKGDDVRVYYSIRNKVFFEKENRLNNLFIFYINKAVFMILLNLFVNSKNNDRYKLIKKAINDGLKGKLGKIL